MFDTCIVEVSNGLRALNSCVKLVMSETSLLNCKASRMMYFHLRSLLVRPGHEFEKHKQIACIWLIRKMRFSGRNAQDMSGSYVGGRVFGELAYRVLGDDVKDNRRKLQNKLCVDACKVETHIIDRHLDVMVEFWGSCRVWSYDSEMTTSMSNAYMLLAFYSGLTRLHTVQDIKKVVKTIIISTHKDEDPPEEGVLLIRMLGLVNILASRNDKRKHYVALNWVQWNKGRMDKCPFGMPVSEFVRLFTFK